MPKADHLVVSCEHAGNRIPAAWRRLFASRAAATALQGHRGYDPGALVLARQIARAFDAPLIFTTWSRLLVEPNRSRHHRALFSQHTRALDAESKQKLIDRYYTPHRSRVEREIARSIARGGRVLHLSVHTFTPTLGGIPRDADVGILYDPKRAFEATLCREWAHAIRSRALGLRVRMNYPYRGSDDGLTTHLRTVFPAARYAGVELEVNQEYPLRQPREWNLLRQILALSVDEVRTVS